VGKDHVTVIVFSFPIRLLGWEEGNVKVHWVIGIVMATGLHAEPQDCNVDVYVITGVPMPVGMLLDARLKAAQRFREIGVNVRIRQGIPARYAGDVCGAPIVVQLEAATRYSVSEDALAYALPYQDSGTCIHVFLDRVLRRNPDPDFANRLLAHVMVHEITHVLEMIIRHSGEGVMKARWSSQDYERMQHDSLPFAPEDVDFIREGLAKRTTHAKAE
jgi:hypothetical protein